MGILDNLEPKEVFRFFGEICGIPHGSGNIEGISDYLADFAGKRGLTCIQDELKNIIIVKEASEGCEPAPPLIIQGHMDMVAVKKPDCPADMSREPLRLRADGDWVYAQDTSLGGDDGIAVAYALALLDSRTIRHPKLEVILTVDEETGMDGAREIDLSMLEGRRMLNLDSEEEGIFLTSCAGGARVDCRIPVKRQETNGIAWLVRVEGLQGGHSGTEIDKGRGNSNCLMGMLLRKLCAAQRNSGTALLYSLSGGLADNAIPRETTAVFVTENFAGEETLRQAAEQAEEEFRIELECKDPGIRVTLERLETDKDEKMYSCLTEETQRLAGSILYLMPNGVQAMSGAIPGLVETSLNLGILRLEEQELMIKFAVRSSVESAKKDTIDRLSLLTALGGGSTAVAGDYPGWAYRKDSPLRETLVSVYRRMYGKEPEIQAIHAGLECGLLTAKLPGLDCISLGPEMLDIHTTEEKLSVSSVRRVWEFLLETLKELAA